MWYISASFQINLLISLCWGAESETETEEEEAKPVTVSFARQDGKDSASQMDEEKWQVLQPIGFEVSCYATHL